MKFGLMVFPSIYDSFFEESKRLLLTQRLEPSVLYLNPRGESIYVKDNKAVGDIDLYLCSVYTRGFEEFTKFANNVGREKIIAGGYHPTAVPQDILPYAHKVVTGYCSNIDEIINSAHDGIFKGSFGFTFMNRDLVDQKSLAQVYPDIKPEYVVGSMVSSVGCPYDCDFCSTPQMSNRRMQVSTIDYVDSEIEDLLRRGVNSVFVRDESFATHPKIVEVTERFKGKFNMVYSFGTGNVMANEELVKKLRQNEWHSLNFGLEDVGTSYRKNKKLKQACDNCHKNGIGVVLSFIVNDENKSKEEALENYRSLYTAFCDLKPAQVCANFLMPMPGTGIWDRYKDKIKPKDYKKYDSKTPVLCASNMVYWHKRMIILLQVAYYYSQSYKNFRNFECGDTLHKRITDLIQKHNILEREWEEIFYDKVTPSLKEEYEFCII